MKNSEIPNEIFLGNIAQAAFCLRSRDLEQAYILIADAMKMEPDAPQPHNLLGIWFELKGNDDKARRHYRAAYSLDPTFAPACKNLEQICTVFHEDNSRTFDFGDEGKEIRFA